MVRFIPSVVLGVYAVVALYIGQAGGSAVALCLATALLVADKHYMQNQEVENLWETIRLMQAAMHDVDIRGHELKVSLDSFKAGTRTKIEDLESSVKSRIGDLAVEVSKSKKNHDDLWSEQ